MHPPQLLLVPHTKHTHRRARTHARTQSVSFQPARTVNARVATKKPSKIGERLFEHRRLWDDVSAAMIKLAYNCVLYLLLALLQQEI